MSLQLPDLANRNYKEIIDEMISSIPKYSNKWTNYNASDPGITILELLSWIAEIDLYRINNITKDSYVNFLRLAAGASGTRVDDLLKILEDDENSDKSHIKVLKFLKEIEAKDLFNWNGIQTGYLSMDNKKLLKFLHQHCGLDWVSADKIDKIDEHTIKLSNIKNSLYLKLNDEKNRMNLQTSDGQSGEFVAKSEDNKLNIYFVPKEFSDMKEAALTFLKSPYKAVIEEDFQKLAIEAARINYRKDAGLKRVIVRGNPAKGKVVIIILLEPDSDKNEYENCKEIVKNYLEPRKLTGTKIIVNEPDFTGIKMDIEVEVFSQIDSNNKVEIEKKIRKKIGDHLDPVSGYDTKGWPYGRNLTIYEIYHVIDDSEGMYHVKKVQFDNDVSLTCKKIDGLIFPVDLTIKVVEGNYDRK